MPTVWTHLMTLGAPAGEKILRAIVVYVFLIVGLRLSGKRELAQLNPFDLVVLLTLSNTVQNAIIGEDNSLLGGLLGAATLLVVNYLTVRFMFKHARIERIVEGHPAVLVQNGKILQQNLHHELINERELKAAARRQGFDSLGEIEEAILEPGGTISFHRKEPATDTVRYNEIIARMDRLSADIAQLAARP